MPRFNRDRLTNCNQAEAGRAAMTVIDRLQDFPKDEQVVGMTGAFLLMLEAYGVTVQDAMTTTKNLINDSNKRLIPEFLAVAQYMQEET